MDSNNQNSDHENGPKYFIPVWSLFQSTSVKIVGLDRTIASTSVTIVGLDKLLRH